MAVFQINFSYLFVKRFRHIA